MSRASAPVPADVALPASEFLGIGRDVKAKLQEFKVRQRGRNNMAEGRQSRRHKR